MCHWKKDAKALPGGNKSKQWVSGCNDNMFIGIFNFVLIELLPYF